MYTLKEIIKHWKNCYGEDIQKEYPGFIKQLTRKEKYAKRKIKSNN